MIGERLAAISMQVICWVLGEYGTVSGVKAGDVMDQLCAITEAQNVSDTVRGYMLSAFSKLAVHSSSGLTPAAQEVQHMASMSANPDLQQRALELEALLRFFSFAIPKSADSRALHALDAAGQQANANRDDLPPYIKRVQIALLNGLGIS